MDCRFSTGQAEEFGYFKPFFKDGQTGQYSSRLECETDLGSPFYFNHSFGEEVQYTRIAAFREARHLQEFLIIYESTGPTRGLTLA